MEKKLWSNAEVVELGVESTKEEPEAACEASEAAAISADAKCFVCKARCSTCKKCTLKRYVVGQIFCGRCDGHEDTVIS